MEPPPAVGSEDEVGRCRSRRRSASRTTTRLSDPGRRPRRRRPACPGRSPPRRWRSRSRRTSIRSVPVPAVLDHVPAALAAVELEDVGAAAAPEPVVAPLPSSRSRPAPPESRSLPRGVAAVELVVAARPRTAGRCPRRRRARRCRRPRTAGRRPRCRRARRCPGRRRAGRSRSPLDLVVAAAAPPPLYVSSASDVPVSSLSPAVAVDPCHRRKSPSVLAARPAADVPPCHAAA